MLLNGATEIAPMALLAQLKPRGRLLDIMVFRPIGTEVSGRPIFDAARRVCPALCQTPEIERISDI